MGYSYTLIDNESITLMIDTKVPIPTGEKLRFEDAKGITDQGISVRVRIKGVEHTFGQSQHHRVLSAYLDREAKEVLWMRPVLEDQPEAMFGFNVLTVVHDYVQRVIEKREWK